MGSSVNAEQRSPTSGRVLLVDDNDSLRRALRRTLAAEGHQVVEASNGREAIKLTKSQDFDLIVSDVRMPDMDGVELLRAIHERDADLPVLLITGDPELETAMKAVEYGALEYLTKPVDIDKLKASTLRALELRRRRLEARFALEAESNRRARGLPAGSSSAGFTGALLGGRYRVGALIGVGGMGAVYEAEREDLAQMRVALKILHPSVGARADLVMRFRREAETIAALDHPNIVRILDFQTPEGEPAFLVMERLQGEPLGDSIVKEGQFTAERAACVACQVLSALSAAHAANVVHRDLKPDNVFLVNVSGLRNLVKLLDFGVAKLMNAHASEKLTQTGSVLGTPAYMSPEQARGAGVDHRSDLYAVGCMMYEVLTGGAPFVAENYNALLFEIQKGVPTPLEVLRPDLDPAFVSVVTRAMAKNPSERFQTADAMESALTPWLAPVSGDGTPSLRKSSHLPLAPTVARARNKRTQKTHVGRRRQAKH
jgi:serine/threonine protein kinase/ActR/RegA family two-component response regulator